MFEKIAHAATDLPVIFQAALGSALFALLLWSGQKLTAHIASKVTTNSKSRRKTFLVEETLKYSLLGAKDYSTRGAYVSLLLYRAARNLIKALIWLTLGLAFFFLYIHIGARWFFRLRLLFVCGPQPTKSTRYC